MGNQINSGNPEIVCPDKHRKDQVETWNQGTLDNSHVHREVDNIGKSLLFCSGLIMAAAAYENSLSLSLTS